MENHTMMEKPQIPSHQAVKPGMQVCIISLRILPGEKNGRTAVWKIGLYLEAPKNKAETVLMAMSDEIPLEKGLYFLFEANDSYFIEKVNMLHVLVWTLLDYHSVEAWPPKQVQYLG